MLIEGFAAVAGVLGARALAHQAILRGLRAPRVPHALCAANLPVAPHLVREAVFSLSSFAHPREVMRRFMADKRVPYTVLGWYVLRHVQRVIGTPFDAIAPLHTIAGVRCPVLLVHGLQDGTVPFDDAARLHAATPDARLLPVDGDRDLREALEPHTHQLVDFLVQAVEQRVTLTAQRCRTA